MGLESAAMLIGHINLWVKLTGKRSAGNLHAAFDEAEAGNGAKGWIEAPGAKRKLLATATPHLLRKPCQLSILTERGRGEIPRPTHLYEMLSLLLTLLTLNLGVIAAPHFPWQPSNQPEIVWEMCSLKIGENDGLAECAMVPMPLRHNEPEGPTIMVAVKRRLGRIPHRRQLWFLDGGPGDSGIVSLPKLSDLFEDIDDLDLYTFDHRGVGGTSLLNCPYQQESKTRGGREIEEEEWDACISYIKEQRDDLDALTVTETAQDLGRLIDAVRKSDTTVFVMGISYGTFLAQRYLQLFPQQPDGVILDGVVPADWSFAEFDSALDRAGRKLLDHCTKDPSCLKHLGRNPQSFYETLLCDIEKGHCKSLGLNPDLAKLILGNMMMIDLARGYIPVVLYRLNRFSWHDKMAILHMFLNLFDEEGPASEPASHSQVLQRHVALSELWNEDDPSQQELENAIENYLMTTNVSASFAATVDKWPKYERDPYDNKFAEYNGPLLMLHGGIDPTMPIERLDLMRQHFSAPHQYFVFVPNGGHVVINEYKCVRSIYLSFLGNPKKPPDTSCVGKTSLINFAEEGKTSEFIFGTTDPWGDQVSLTEWALKIVYHVPVIVVALLSLIIAVVSLGRRTRGAGKKGDSPPYIRLVTSTIIWFVVFFAWRQAGLILPVLLDYKAVHTLAIATLMTILHVVICLLLIRWIRRGYFRLSRKQLT